MGCVLSRETYPISRQKATLQTSGKVKKYFRLRKYKGKKVKKQEEEEKCMTNTQESVLVTTGHINNGPQSRFKPSSDYDFKFSRLPNESSSPLSCSSSLTKRNLRSKAFSCSTLAITRSSLFVENFDSKLPTCEMSMSNPLIHSRLFPASSQLLHSTSAPLLPSVLFSLDTTILRNTSFGFITTASTSTPVTLKVPVSSITDPSHITSEELISNPSPLLHGASIASLLSDSDSISSVSLFPNSSATSNLSSTTSELVSSHPSTTSSPPSTLISAVTSEFALLLSDLLGLYQALREYASDPTLSQSSSTFSLPLDPFSSNFPSHCLELSSSSSLSCATSMTSISSHFSNSSPPSPVWTLSHSSSMVSVSSYSSDSSATTSQSDHSQSSPVSNLPRSSSTASHFSFTFMPVTLESEFILDDLSRRNDSSLSHASTFSASAFLHEPFSSDTLLTSSTFSLPHSASISSLSSFFSSSSVSDDSDSNSTASSIPSTFSLNSMREFLLSNAIASSKYLTPPPTPPPTAHFLDDDHLFFHFSNLDM